MDITEGKTRARQDFDDLELERAGIFGSRASRFMPENDPYRPGTEPQRRKREDGFAALAACVRRQAQLIERMREIEEAVLRAAQEAARREEEQRQALERIRAAATRTDDGRIVYRTADGSQAFDEDGRQLTGEEIARIAWNPSAPTWEQRQEAGRRLEEAMRRRQEIERYANRLRENRDRVTGGDALSAAEIDGIEAEIGAMPEAICRQTRGPGRMSAASAYGGGAGQGASLAPAFGGAAAALPAITTPQAAAPALDHAPVAR